MRRVIGVPLVLVGVAVFSTFSVVAAQETPPEPGWSATLGIISIPGHELYSGRVNVRSGGVNSGGRYAENTELGVGIQAQAFLTSEMLGDISISAFGVQATSEGFYSGIGGEQTRTRDLTTVGLDVGWEPSIWSSARSSLRVPFGPSVMWQSLDLSSGHRDHYAAPGGLGEPPEVRWSDRVWLSLGGYGGLGFTMRLGDHLGLTLDGTGRFLFSDKGSWAGQEEEDILASTGDRVILNYEQPILFFWTARAGLLWRP